MQWIHEVGPVMHYMAECTGVADCTTFDAANAKWFKIDEQGLKSDGATWVMQDLYDGKPVKLNIPENLKKGNYLLRSEVIALHRANVEGGAEFYPSCTQVRIGGNGNGTPNATVTFPGAYSDTEAGILTPDVCIPPVPHICSCCLTFPVYRSTTRASPTPFPVPRSPPSLLPARAGTTHRPTAPPVPRPLRRPRLAVRVAATTCTATMHARRTGPAA